jgi:acyl-coenzyme A synthetase/AMP-(fatty) acid ligase
VPGPRNPRAALSEAPPVEPDRTPDPVAAVLAAHDEGRSLALPTAGTTGSARRVLRTTDSWWASFAAYTDLTGVAPGARLWVPGPLEATMNLFAAVHAAAVGARAVREPGAASHACLTPAQLDRHGAQLRSGTSVVVAGDALPDGLAAVARKRRLAVAHYYGASELSFVASSRAGEPLAPFPGVEVDVRGGELWVRSPYLCLGYAGSSGTLRRDPDGWATVGDLGRYDGHTVTVLGRPGHVVTGGATVALAEVESALAAVASAPIAVCGLAHPTLGGIVTAVLTEAADREPLERHARASLPPSHRPRLWRVVAELPLTGSGKVDRQALATLLEGTHV